jgi:hypothetical protein
LIKKLDCQSIIFAVLNGGSNAINHRLLDIFVTKFKKLAATGVILKYAFWKILRSLLLAGHGIQSSQFAILLLPQHMKDIFK